MPLHQPQQPLIINNEELQQGMNNSAPIDMWCPLIKNMYQDRASGAWITRWPFVRTKFNAPVEYPVTGLTRWKSSFFYTANGTLYYGDGLSVGAVTGTSPPVFKSFNNFLFVASGGKLQKVNTSFVIANVAEATCPTTSTVVLVDGVYLWVTGDTTDPDYVVRSAEQNEEGVWGTIYSSFGYKDGGNFKMTGLTYGPGEYLIGWKNGEGKKAIGFYDPEDTSFSTDNVPHFFFATDAVAPHTHRAAVYSENVLWIMDKIAGPMAIVGTDATEQIVIDKMSLDIGRRILNGWDMDEYGFAVYYPPDSQIWFFPGPGLSNTINILHTRTGAWSQFIPEGDLSFYSAFYYASTGVLYLGGNDGYIYKYDASGQSAFQDEPGGVATDISQRIKTKVYDPYPFEEEKFSPRVIFNCRVLEDGAGTFRIWGDYGSTIDYSEDITLAATYASLDDWSTYTLDDLSEVGMSSTTLNLSKFEMPRVALNDNFQFDIQMTSGAWAFHSIAANVRPGRYK